MQWQRECDARTADGNADSVPFGIRVCIGREHDGLQYGAGPSLSNIYCRLFDTVKDPMRKKSSAGQFLARVEGSMRALGQLEKTWEPDIPGDAYAGEGAFAPGQDRGTLTGKSRLPSRNAPVRVGGPNPLVPIHAAAYHVRDLPHWRHHMSLTSDLMVAVFTFISALEGNTGYKIAVLDRIEDPQQFWVRSAAILCKKTGDNFCDADMRFMTANTEPSGMSRIIEYKDKANPNAPIKRVCAILPPINKIDPTYIGEAFGTGFPNTMDMPREKDTQAWLTLYHAAHCLDSNGTPFEEKRAAAFATLGLAIIDANPKFVAGKVRSPPRQLAVISGQEAAYWAAGIGERLLLDLWKGEAAERLRDEYDCEVTLVSNTSIDVERITRDAQLAPDEACAPSTPSSGTAEGGGTTGGFTSTPPKGKVTDANIWIWMYGSGGLGVPPMRWAPWKMFGSASEAAKYTWTTAETLAKQK